MIKWYGIGLGNMWKDVCTFTLACANLSDSQALEVKVWSVREVPVLTPPPQAPPSSLHATNSAISSHTPMNT